jgi:hypothetical protein
MILSEVNEFAILVSALLTLALGSIWYSPLVFGKHWQRAAELADDDLVFSQAELLRSLFVGFVSNLTVMYVIALMLRQAGENHASLKGVALSLIALFAAFVASMVVWEKKSGMYFSIHVGYGILVVLVGCSVLSLWPW